MGRPPTVSSVNVQLKSVKSSQLVVSSHVPWASFGMSFLVGQPVALALLEAEEVRVAEGRNEMDDGDDVGAVASSAAAPVFAPTLMTFAATRTPINTPMSTSAPPTTAITITTTQR